MVRLLSVTFLLLLVGADVVGAQEATDKLVSKLRPEYQSAEPSWLEIVFPYPRIYPPLPMGLQDKALKEVSLRDEAVAPECRKERVVIQRERVPMPDTATVFERSVARERWTIDRCGFPVEYDLRYRGSWCANDEPVLQISIILPRRTTALLPAPR